MNKGFTLIEILLVLILLSIVTAISLPQFSRSYQRLALREVAGDMAYLMRYAQSRAIHTARPLKLHFSDDRKSYWLTQAAAEDDAADGESGEPPSFEKLTGRFGRVFHIPEDITVESAGASIEFNPDGRIEKTQIDVCRNQDCLIISTLHQSGSVVLGEPGEEGEDAL